MVKLENGKIVTDLYAHRQEQLPPVQLSSSVSLQKGSSIWPIPPAQTNLQ